MRRDGWGDDELRILEGNYREHGSDWTGWESLLLGRTVTDIERQAKKMGLDKPSAPKPESMESPLTKDNGYVRKNVRTPKPEPYKELVFELLDRGLSAKDIDKLMKWPSGRCFEILTDRQIGGLT